MDSLDNSRHIIQNLLNNTIKQPAGSEADRFFHPCCRTGQLHARSRHPWRRAAAAGSIGLPSSVSKLVTVPLTREFRRRLPEAKLALTEAFSVAMNEALVLFSARPERAAKAHPMAKNSDHR